MKFHFIWNVFFYFLFFLVVVAILFPSRGHGNANCGIYRKTLHPQGCSGIRWTCQTCIFCGIFSGAPNQAPWLPWQPEPIRTRLLKNDWPRQVEHPRSGDATWRLPCKLPLKYSLFSVSRCHTLQEAQMVTREWNNMASIFKNADF